MLIGEKKIKKEVKEEQEEEMKDQLVMQDYWHERRESMNASWNKLKMTS